MPSSTPAILDGEGCEGWDVHLFAAVDQALLDGGDAFFFFYALFYFGDLCSVLVRIGVGGWLMWTEGMGGGVPCSPARCRVRSLCP